MVLVLAGCGDDSQGVGIDAPGGAGGAGGNGGTGGSGGAPDASRDAPDAAIDAPPDAQPDAMADARVPSCGDGILDPGELCDRTIPAGMTGACPTSCTPSTDPCVSITLVGAGTCQAHCQTTTITAFISGDGCCPAGGSFSMDNDCPSVCGNGALEPGESCDTTIASGMPGACPTDCDDSEPCTIDALVGGGSCAAHCTHTAVTTIGLADGCCPTGGTPANDLDCSPGCGNGQLDAGELCDVAIATGSSGACPTSCTPPSVCFSSALISTGTCQAHCADTPLPGTACDDASICNGREICDASGVCQPGSPLTCGDGNPCTQDSCDPVSGCQHANLTGQQVGCDNNNACDGVELCVIGGSGVSTCQPGTPLVCNDGNGCTDDTCNAATGCVHTGVVGRSCADGDPCNGAETCNAAGACVAGTPIVCNDNNVCTSDSCSPGVGCVFTPLPALTSCSDGNACNGLEICDGSGGCQQGGPPNCNDSNPCTADSCNSAAPFGTNPCVNSPQPAGTSCDDTTLCNGRETCNGAGSCQSGTVVNCDDVNPCTADSCDQVLGCRHMITPGVSCVPTNACASSGMCDNAGACIPQGGIVCNDFNPCTSDSCDSVAGCQFANVANGTSCSSDPCAPAACLNGSCQAGTPPTCSDGNPCTVDSCTAGIGCTFDAAAANGSSCSTDFCNPAICANGACNSAPPPNCDDSNPCTTDGCSGACFHNPVPQGTACDDATICNGRETCNGFGFCNAGTPLICSDGNPCTTDACNPVTGCTFTVLADGSTPGGCTDPNSCNGIESCQSGLCTAGAPPADCTTCQTCVSTSPTTHTCGPRDQDGDGFGDCGCPRPPGAPPTVTCANGSVVQNCDCNDSDAAVFPCAAETCDGKDNDCDGSVDPNFRSFRQPCSSNSECCSGVCAQDALGQLRCDVGGSQCKPANDTCQSSSQCCSGECASAGGGPIVCAPSGGCLGTGNNCVRSWDCCSLFCDSSDICSTAQLCKVQGSSCTTNAECCDDNCAGPAGNKTCQSTVNGGCATIGESCSSGGTCCSNDCVNGRCYFASACQAAGDLCQTNSDCCNSHCDPATHRCDTLGSCQPSGEPCSISGARNCCSNLCVYNGIGSGVCLTLNGCSPDEEICNTDNDCCSFLCGSPDALGLRRCRNPPGCQPPGEVCGGQGATNNCCCPNGQTCCRGTITGVERCFGQPANACIPSSCSSNNQCAVGFACTSNNQCPTGMTCNTAVGKCTWGGCIPNENTCPCRFDDECCSRQCLPDPQSPTGFSCSPSCRPDGGTCRADSDCCSGACVNGICQPGGGDDCIPIGGACQVTTQCCFGTCSGGTCQFGGF